MADGSSGRVVRRIVAKAWAISSVEVGVGVSIDVAEGSMLVFEVGISGSRVEMRTRVVWRGRSGCHDSIYSALLVSLDRYWRGWRSIPNQRWPESYPPWSSLGSGCASYSDCSFCSTKAHQQASFLLPSHSSLSIEVVTSHLTSTRQKALSSLS